MNTNSPYIPNTKILDDFYRDLEPEFGALGFATAKLKNVNEEQRTAVFVISSGEIDRYGEIVDPKAFDDETIAAYMDNNVALAAHQHAGFSGEPTVVGNWIQIWREGDKTYGEVKFDTDDIGEKYWGKVKRGVMKACSIGFIVRAWEMREVGTGQNKRSVRVFTKIELLEISIVAVPANRQAIMKAAGFGVAGQLPSVTGEAQVLKSSVEYAIDIDSLNQHIEQTITKVLTDPLGPMDAHIREVVAAVQAGESCGHDHYGASVTEADADDQLKRVLENIAAAD